MVIFIDFRWNYSYICLSRLVEYYVIIRELTHTLKSSDIPGILQSQVANLKSFYMQSYEWQLALALIEVLAPFYTATKLLSVRSRQTFGDAFCILKQLKSFLETESSAENVEVLEDEEDISSWKAELNELKTNTYYEVLNYLKTLLLAAFKLYTERHMSQQMNEALLVIFNFFT